MMKWAGDYITDDIDDDIDERFITVETKFYDTETGISFTKVATAVCSGKVKDLEEMIKKEQQANSPYIRRPKSQAAY